MQHLESGPTTLDMSTPVSGSTTSDPVSDPNAKTGDTSTPLLPYQKMIVAHAVLCTIGFLILLPSGALLARYTRTFTNAWFRGHWVFQLAVGESGTAPAGMPGAEALIAIHLRFAVHSGPRHHRGGYIGH